MIMTRRKKYPCKCGWNYGDCYEENEIIVECVTSVEIYTLTFINHCGENQTEEHVCLGSHEIDVLKELLEKITE